MFLAPRNISRRYGVRSLLAVALMVVAIAAGARAEDKTIHIKLPKRAAVTPVEHLNREGVKAVQKQQYERARQLFFRAYLLDPNDPFTLNNLGYISEIEGHLGQAQRYYDLAHLFGSDAAVELATSKDLEGKPVSLVAGDAAETGMQINRINVAAIHLLLKGRAPEADLMLENALKLDPRNPFTLNNLGYSKEKEGELEKALSFYNQAARLDSREPIVVTVNKNWRGKPISEVAERNASKLREELKKEQTPAARVARLNLEGVSAMNRNDHSEARRDFRAAYKLDPHNSFTLNNMGYLAELDGDRETADFYYQRARQAQGHKDKVTIATRASAEGHPVGQVAESSDQKVDAFMRQEQEIKRREGGPIRLQRRDNTPVSDSNPAVQSSTGNQSTGQPAPPASSNPDEPASPNGITASPLPGTR